MPHKNQSCNNCHFFLESGSKEDGKIGYCRANPPYPYTSPQGKPGVGRFPIVLSSQWCGMWDQADEPAKETKPKVA